MKLDYLAFGAHPDDVELSCHLARARAGLHGKNFARPRRQTKQHGKARDDERGKTRDPLTEVAPKTRKNFPSTNR